VVFKLVEVSPVAEDQN